MQKLVTSEQIRKLESEWISKINPNWSLTLMEKAGSALSDVAKGFKEPFLIVCGKGNNGGDGLVAARYLFNSGKKVAIFLTSDESSLSKDAKVNLELIKHKVQITKINSIGENGFYNALSASNTVIDCLLGTGINGQLSDLFSWIIKAINDSGKSIIACDIPSGVNPDTGDIPTAAIKANITVTFGYAKLGLLIQPARKHTGEVRVIDIGLPDIETNLFLLDDQFLKNNLPKRDVEANKGSFGRTLLVCGSKKYPGAALLASKAAASIGSGLTSLASPEEVLIKIAPVTPEVTHVEFNLTRILEESLKSSVLVVGPGLGTSEEIKSFVEGIILSTNIPIVLDADGINVLEGNKEIIKKAKKEVVLTPHPKEMARLLGVNLEEVLKDKIGTARKAAGELNCTVILKGAGTVIATKDGKIFISPFSNPALAKGGTGDVLSGFIGGLIAQKLEPYLAACLGVYIHGKIGEHIAKDKTVFSLLPQDLIMYLPQTLKEFVC